MGTAESTLRISWRCLTKSNPVPFCILRYLSTVRAHPRTGCELPINSLIEPLHPVRSFRVLTEHVVDVRGKSQSGKKRPIFQTYFVTRLELIKFKKIFALKKSFFRTYDCPPLTPALPHWGRGRIAMPFALPIQEISFGIDTANTAPSQPGDAQAAGAKPPRAS